MFKEPPQNYEEYVEACEAAKLEFLSKNPKSFVRYIRKNQQKRGIIILTRNEDTGVIRLGWSLFNKKAEAKGFSKPIAFMKAIDSLRDVTNIDPAIIPDTVRINLRYCREKMRSKFANESIPANLVARKTQEETASV